MDYVKQKVKLLALMKMSGGNKPPKKTQVKGGRKYWRIDMHLIVRRG